MRFLSVPSARSALDLSLYQPIHDPDGIDEAARRATRRGWKVGSGVEQEVFAAAEYREHARPGDYTDR